MERFNKTVTAKRVACDVEKDKINLNSIIQRGEVWSVLQKSLLIHSMLSDFPVPPLFAQENKDDAENILYIMDGKQRILTISQYLTDGFALHKNTPAHNGKIIAEKLFSELDEETQDKIKDFTLLIYYFRNMTEQERDEMFLRLNGGKALSRIELTRVEAGEEFMEYIREIAQNEFFTNCNFTASALNKFVDEEVILHCLNLMLYDGSDGLSGKVISDMAKELKTDPLTENNKKELEDTIEFLSLAFLEKEKFLKKVNIPIIFMIGLQAKNNMTASEFCFKVKQFFTSPTEEYTEAARVGSAKVENVHTRIDELYNFVLDNMDETEDMDETEPDDFNEEQEELDKEYGEELDKLAG